MNLVATTPEVTASLVRLLDSAAPVLVEIRFPNAATAPDWRLCEDGEQFEQILAHLGAGVELHVSSVWDLTNPKGAICIRK
jgi:hypothetical protein